MTELERAILKTIIYFDIFDYPLTSFEIWKWLYKYECTIEELVDCLEHSNFLNDKITHKDGFYFLSGRDGVVLERKLRRDWSLSKIKKAVKVCRVLKFFPFIRMFAISGSLSFFNTKKLSDIDVFIIIEKKHLWLSRFLITLFLHIFGLRRYGNRVNNKICLNFFLSTSALDLEKLIQDEDFYSCYINFSRIIIFEVENMSSKFYNSNLWIKKYLPNMNEFKPTDILSVKDNFYSKNIRSFFEFLLSYKLGDFLENKLKKIQIFRLSQNEELKLKDGIYVALDDEMIKTHKKKTGDYYNNLLIERFENIIK